MRRILFFGGNGHCAARLALARAELLRREAVGEPHSELMDVAYPGFERRSRASDWPGFLDELAAEAQKALGAAPSASLVYATGIGALLALCLRARGELVGVPILMQGPVLWGLKRRLFPRVMRYGPLPGVVRSLFRVPAFQERFTRKYFLTPLSPSLRAAFFQGYADCPAFPDLFRWLTPEMLHRLTVSLQPHPECLTQISVVWGSCDRVVGLDEVHETEAALGVKWDVDVIPKWGHYPMLDDAAGWVEYLTVTRSEAGGEGSR